jgi:hypothetical protein
MTNEFCFVTVHLSTQISQKSNFLPKPNYQGLNIYSNSADLVPCDFFMLPELEFWKSEIWRDLILNILRLRGRCGSSVSIVTRLQARRLGFDSWNGQGRDFSSPPPLGPTELPTQWLPVAVSLGVKLTNQLHLVPRLKCMWLYLHHP